MKYIVLMQFSENSELPPMDTWPKEDVRRQIDFMEEINRRLVADGEWVDAQGLADPSQARIVRARPGEPPSVQEAPFPASKEFLVGFWIIEVPDLGRAITFAASVSAAPGPGGVPLNMPIEVREVMSGPPDPDEL
jgi:hypothetical protein